MERRCWTEPSTGDTVLESREGSRSLRTRITEDDLLGDPDAVERGFLLIEEKIRQARKEGKPL